jgi:hypothetical protein
VPPVRPRGKPCFLHEPLPAFRIARERHRDDDWIVYDPDIDFNEIFSRFDTLLKSGIVGLEYDVVRD